MGKLLLHKIIDGELPSSSTLISTIVDGTNLGDQWNYFEVDIQMSGYTQSSTVEVNAAKASALFVHDI